MEESEMRFSYSPALGKGGDRMQRLYDLAGKYIAARDAMSKKTRGGLSCKYHLSIAITVNVGLVPNDDLPQGELEEALAEFIKELGMPNGATTESWDIIKRAAGER